MKALTQTYEIAAPIKKVWRALVNPKVINAWGGGPARMDDKIGATFKLWGGDVHGKNIDVQPPKLLKQEWYGGDWPEASIATFSLNETNGTTTVKFHQENIPDNEFDDIADGWQRYYLGPIKELLEK